MLTCHGSYFCLLGEYTAFAREGSNSNQIMYAVFKVPRFCVYQFTRTSYVSLGQRTLRWKEFTCLTVRLLLYTVIVKPILNTVCIESIIDASSAEGCSGGRSKRDWRWNHITSTPLLLPLLLERRSLLDEKLKQSNNNFIFKSLPARWSYTDCCPAPW